MSRKNQNQKVSNNEVSNLEVSNLEAAVIMQPEEPQAQAENTQEVPTPESTNAVDEATKELEELKAKMAEAKKKLAEAKKAATKSRPVRMSTFVVRVCQSRAKAMLGEGEQMFKSDVHYCAEKTAIDVMAEDIKCGLTNEYVYAICKRSKADEENEVVVELLWTDHETNQIVIE